MRQALLSVYDKTGLVPFARGLSAASFALVASGGTARALSAAGLGVRSVEELTGSPEMLGGRVKTLHPRIHGAILARRSDGDLAELAALGIAPIDVVVCNLYPFEETVRRGGASESEAIEEIDIGGVTLLRAAAKNHAAVTVVTSPADYERVLAELTGGGPTPERRRALALAAFRHTAAYDAAIASWLGERCGEDEAVPATLSLTAERVQQLRYGENPHQRAAFYRWRGSEPAFAQLSGKELSFNNLFDLDAAWAAAQEHDEPAVAIVKHSTICGLAVAPGHAEAFRLALDCDPVSAFGSVIAVNGTVDLDFVEATKGLFLEVLLAAAYTEDARQYLARKKKKCRVLLSRPGTPERRTIRSIRSIRSIRGGLVAQTTDDRGVDESAWRVVTKRAPSEEERRSLAFAWLAVKHVRSNAIALARGTATVGIGGGETNRVDAVRHAADRAGERAEGAVMGSDAFFPFPDGVEVAAAAGVSACIQPGGSIRDEEVIAAADRLGMAMVFTGERHFRH